MTSRSPKQPDKHPHAETENTKEHASATVHVLITAAGSGQRFKISGQGHEDYCATPKQYQNIGRKSVIQYGIDAFLQCPKIGSIRCIIDPEHANMYHDAVLPLQSIKKLYPPVHGGKTRQESVYNGLQALNAETDVKDEDLVLIHDAARPLLSVAEIESIIQSLSIARAATLAKPVSETIRKQDKSLNCDGVIDRTELWAMQTPQGFRLKDILLAHKNSVGKEHTDDTSLVSALGIAVKLVEGKSTNFKITTKDDYEMAQKILMQNPAKIRSGIGYDVHAFDKAQQDPAKQYVRLCGVDVPYARPLKGHSDADVGLHAITDAILGAIGEGDIGQHFPPSDNTYKDMDSAIFLEETMNILRAKKASLNNIDLTLICEEPKIGPFAPEMRQRVADIVALNVDDVNIKATTSEKLGFTGRKEGIAAQAIVSIAQETG